MIGVNTNLDKNFLDHARKLAEEVEETFVSKYGGFNNLAESLQKVHREKMAILESKKAEKIAEVRQEAARVRAQLEELEARLNRLSRIKIGPDSRSEEILNLLGEKSEIKNESPQADTPKTIEPNPEFPDLLTPKGEPLDDFRKNLIEKYNTPAELIYQQNSLSPVKLETLLGFLDKERREKVKAALGAIYLSMRAQREEQIEKSDDSKMKEWLQKSLINFHRGFNNGLFDRLNCNNIAYIRKTIKETLKSADFRKIVENNFGQESVVELAKIHDFWFSNSSRMWEALKKFEAGEISYQELPQADLLTLCKNLYPEKDIAKFLISITPSGQREIPQEQQEQKDNADQSIELNQKQEIKKDQGPQISDQILDILPASEEKKWQEVKEKFNYLKNLVESEDLNSSLVQGAVSDFLKVLGRDYLVVQGKVLEAIKLHRAEAIVSRKELNFRIGTRELCWINANGELEKFNLLSIYPDEEQQAEALKKIKAAEQEIEGIMKSKKEGKYDADPQEYQRALRAARRKAYGEFAVLLANFSLKSSSDAVTKPESGKEEIPEKKERESLKDKDLEEAKKLLIDIIKTYYEKEGIGIKIKPENLEKKVEAILKNSERGKIKKITEAVKKYQNFVKEVKILVSEKEQEGDQLFNEIESFLPELFNQMAKQPSETRNLWQKLIERIKKSFLEDKKEALALEEAQKAKETIESGKETAAKTVAEIAQKLKENLGSDDLEEILGIKDDQEEKLSATQERQRKEKEALAKKIQERAAKKSKRFRKLITWATIGIIALEGGIISALLWGRKADAKKIEGLISKTKLVETANKELIEEKQFLEKQYIETLEEAIEDQRFFQEFLEHQFRTNRHATQNIRGLQTKFINPNAAKIRQ